MADEDDYDHGAVKLKTEEGVKIWYHANGGFSLAIGGQDIPNEIGVISLEFVIPEREKGKTGPPIPRLSLVLEPMWVGIDMAPAEIEAKMRDGFEDLCRGRAKGEE